MVWSHYADESNLINNDITNQLSDEEVTPVNQPMELDDWMEWHSNDLMNMWSSLKTYTCDMGLQTDIINLSDYVIFCEFCYDNSSKYPSKNAS